LIRYSQRLPWSVPANPLTLLLEQKRKSGARLLDLTISNPTEVLEDYPHAAIAEAFREISDMTYRPDPFGESPARTALSALYAKKGIAVSPARLALTASTSEAYALLFKLLCDPESEILVPSPSYPLFEYLAALESVRPVPYRLLYDGAWFLDFDSLRNRITGRTRAIVLVNPNNPTGSFLKPRELTELLQVASQQGLPLISDEVFLDYPIATGDRVPTLIGNQSVLSFSLNGLSKSACMPQMKLGWIAVNGPEQECVSACQRLELILDTYLSVNTPVQRALPRLLEIGSGLRHQLLERIRNNLKQMHALLLDSPAHVLHLEGGWSAILQVPRTLSEEMWVSHLTEEYSLIVQPGYFFDMPQEAYLVVSLILPPALFGEGIAKIRAALDRYA
jgi:alanine-synthesizing transaminase